MERLFHFLTSLGRNVDIKIELAKRSIPRVKVLIAGH
jgi:hypothetical protein